MFPQIKKIKSRVLTNQGCEPVVQFYDSEQKNWDEEIVLDFNRSGMAIFTLDTDDSADPYIFFGALQKTEDGCNPDTNWDFMINGAGNIICFNNDCQSAQDISVRLTLIQRGDDEFTNAIISADPRIRNRPS
ncbi:DP-EP family protein [Paraglaciecola chathamensis]|uniref:DP-EP family protein n=1 Tax=Paraglaciecola chathamensis TaxID=368405 RepID=UPI000587E332|nr:DP-EP family protein [Paraglaciecola agarilytica]